MKEDVHPKNVNPNVVRIRPKPRGFKIVECDVDCSILQAGSCVHRIDHHCLCCQLKKFGKVVQH